MTSSAFWLCLRPDPGAGSVGERMIEAARVACLLDSAERAHDAGFAQIVVHTTAPELFEHVGGLSLQRTDPQAAIGSVVAAAALHAAGPVCYAGAGMPAMTAADWQAVRERITAGQAVANNVHSCDLLGVPHAASLAAVGCDPVDNGFARRLRDDAGLDIAVLERSAQTLLDLDTPPIWPCSASAARPACSNSARASASCSIATLTSWLPCASAWLARSMC